MYRQDGSQVLSQTTYSYFVLLLQKNALGGVRIGPTLPIREPGLVMSHPGVHHRPPTWATPKN